HVGNKNPWWRIIPIVSSSSSWSGISAPAGPSGSEGVVERHEAVGFACEEGCDAPAADGEHFAENEADEDIAGLVEGGLAAILHDEFLADPPDEEAEPERVDHGVDEHDIAHRVREPEDGPSGDDA